MNNKEYIIPEDLHQVYLDFRNYIALKNDFVNSKFFGFKRAVKAGRLGLQKQYDFWNAVYELYPNLKNVRCEYNSINRVVELKEEKPEEKNSNQSDD